MKLPNDLNYLQEGIYICSSCEADCKTGEALYTHLVRVHLLHNILAQSIVADRDVILVRKLTDLGYIGVWIHDTFVLKGKRVPRSRQIADTFNRLYGGKNETTR